MRLPLLLFVALTALAEEPVRVSFCDLVKDRESFDHKLVEVTAFVSHGFEDFTLFDPRCDGDTVWLDYGGTLASGTIYCCGVTAERTRPEPLTIDGVTIPLQMDERLRTFDRLLEGDATAHATLVGHFFRGGQGHFGLYDLLAIERVVSFDPPRRDLDMRASFDAPETWCLGFAPVPRAEILAAQRAADSGARGWSVSDPKRVAAEALARIDPQHTGTLKEVRRAQGRVFFQTTDYWLVVAKPYWLSFFAKDPKRVAWVYLGGYQLRGCKPEE